MALTSGEIRTLGKLEQYSSSRHSLGLHTCIINTCEYSVPQTIQKSGQLQLWFRHALKDVISGIPALRVGIRDELTKQPTFVSTPNITLSKHIAWKQRASRGVSDGLQDLLRTLEAEQAKGFSNIDEQPPWRISCIENADDGTASTRTLHVLFAVHHTLADGVSTILFHRALLDALNRSSASASNLEKDVDTISFSDGLVLPLALEDKLKFYVSWPFFLKTIWNEISPKWLSSSQTQQPWAGKPYTQTPNQTCIRLVIIPAESLASILQACRGNTITLTPLLHAIALHALVKNMQEDDAAAFTALTSINLRPFIEDLANNDESRHREMFGVYYTSENHHIEQSTVHTTREALSLKSQADTILIVARQIIGELQTRRKMIPNDDGVGLLPYITDFHSRWKGMYGRPRDVTWEVSNIGSMEGGSQDDSEDESCTIVQSIFTQPGHVTGPAFSVNVSGVQSHGITVTLCWQQEVVSTDLMEAVAKDIESMLHNLSVFKGLGGET